MQSPVLSQYLYAMKYVLYLEVLFLITRHEPGHESGHITTVGRTSSVNIEKTKRWKNTASAGKYLYRTLGVGANFIAHSEIGQSFGLFWCTRRSPLRRR